MKKINKKIILICLLAAMSLQLFSGCSGNNTSDISPSGNNVYTVEMPSSPDSKISLPPDLTTYHETEPETEPGTTIDMSKIYPDDEYFTERLGDSLNPETVYIKYDDAKSVDGNYYFFDTAYIEHCIEEYPYPVGNSIENPEMFEGHGYAEEVEKSFDSSIQHKSEYIKLSVGDVYGKNNMTVTDIEKKVVKSKTGTPEDPGPNFGKTLSTSISFEGTATMKGYVCDSSMDVFFIPYASEADGILPIHTSNAFMVTANLRGVNVGGCARYPYYLGESKDYDTSEWGERKFIEAEVTVINPSYYGVWDASLRTDNSYSVESAEIKLIRVIENKGE